MAHKLAVDLREHKTLLRFIASTKPNVAHAVLQKADQRLAKLLSETAYNLLVDNIEISETVKEDLKPKKNVLIKLATSKLYNVRKALIQKRGNLKLIQTLAKLLVGTFEETGPLDQQDRADHEDQDQEDLDI